MDPKQQFYRHFLERISALRDEITQLQSITVAGVRQQAIDQILVGITKLQNEVSDAAEFTPSYDRRQYAENIKGLQDSLNQTVAQVTPKSRFQFKKSVKPSAPAGSSTSQHDPRLNPGRDSPAERQSAQQLADSPARDVTDNPLARDGKDYNAEIALLPKTHSPLRKPSFTHAQSVKLSGHEDIHILLPVSASRATASGSLTNIKSCVVDMSDPTTQGPPFQGLALRDIENSVIVAGRVDGPVHITAVRNSVIVVAARQARIHECVDVDVYLICGSHPIIEDCSGMRFAPLPAPYATAADAVVENQWDQVDDFKWLKSGPSPNWKVMPEAERRSDRVWTQVLRDESFENVRDMLSKVGLPGTQGRS